MSRTIDVFSAGCPVCDQAIETVREAACPSCDVVVEDMNDPDVAARAEALGVRSVPAVVIDGVLSGCCSGAGPDVYALRSAGLGQPI
ncbi:MAG: thioredoxin family protein [Gemmatimonadales bacterium]